MGRFLVFHPVLDIYGGGEKVCHNIIKTLVNHGQSVELLTFNFNEKRYQEIMNEKFPASVNVFSIEKRVEEPPFTIYKRHQNITKLLRKAKKNLQYDFFFSTQSPSLTSSAFLNKPNRNIAYVHFPEIHFEYDHSNLRRKIYLWLFKKWIEEGVKKVGHIFCNSIYSKEAIEQYWGSLEIKDPVVVYPPINLDMFWCERPLMDRAKRITYVGRFVSIKRHEIMKKLAIEFPMYEFISIGGLQESEKRWYERFSENIPKNYILKPNLPNCELINTLQNSRIYVHLMEGEHFGISPIEAVASGCITLVHNSGGVREFLPSEFRWNNYGELRGKIAEIIETQEKVENWDRKREELWENISTLSPINFQNNIWSILNTLI